VLATLDACTDDVISDDVGNPACPVRVKQPRLAYTNGTVPRNTYGETTSVSMRHALAGNVVRPCG
jgi:hypothetical protein